MPPAARITDNHTCPIHGGGPIVTGSPDVITGNRPQARVTDKLICLGVPIDVIAKGSSTVFVNNLMAARITDLTVHAGVIVTGYPTVIIGEVGMGGVGCPFGN